MNVTFDKLFAVTGKRRPGPFRAGVPACAEHRLDAVSLPAAARQASRPLFFLRGFARVSPVFVFGLLSLCSSASSAATFPTEGFASFFSSPAVPASPAPTTAERRQAASSQFTRAEEQRAALNNKSAEKRTLADYKQVVSTYRRVYLITPHAGEVPDSLLAVAELYTEMGERWGRTYYQSAVDTYQFLMREYPTSRYCQDAYLRSAKLQRDQLGDTGGAKNTYDAFLKKFPHSPHKREAQEARAELALLQSGAPADTSKPDMSVAARNSDSSDAAGPAKSATKEKAAAAPAEIAKSSDGDDEAATSDAPKPSGRIPEIHKISAKAGAESTRVTIDLDGSVQYVSGRIANPDRIYFDIHAAKLTPQLIHKKIQVDGSLLSAVRVAQNPSGVVRVVLDVAGVKDYSASLLNNPARMVIELYASNAPVQAAKSNSVPEPAAQPPVLPVNSKTAAVNDASLEKAEVAAAPASTSKPALKRAAPGDDAADSTPQPKNKLATAKMSKGKPDLLQPATAPQPTRDGQATLTRALGLKVGRIVIDAGHGGHDTGTIGPSGLMEKDLCLDVALRLGKIIQQRLPGAEVVYTRSDDTFIPLEERTHIANEAKADMFISIHANSSQDSGARGIETYYLNLKGSAEAMEVAARENSTSDQGIHELQDLVKQIARTEKIEESREFAEDVQDSLAKRVQKTAKPVKNRGVRKAPFVVLIGADMPSILTEISFLSNPADEKLLKQPDHRQRVAEGIYQGVANYLQNINSMAVNQSSIPAGPAPKRTSTSASVESSRNRN